MKAQLITLTAAFGTAEKKFSINFSKADTKFFNSLNYNGDDSYLFLTEKKSIGLKSIIKISTFQLCFAQEAYLKMLVLLSIEKYFFKKMYMIFQSITMLLINLICYTFPSV